MSLTDSKITKTQLHFRSLSEIAPTLNSASDELNKAINLLDEALKKLNIGLTAWVTIRSRGVEDWEYDDDQIGYTKVEGKWGIAVRRIWGDNRDDHHGGDGPWLFNDSPRELRLLGVDKIPEVIEALGKEASVAAKQIQLKAKEVRELASIVGGIVTEKHPLTNSLRESVTTLGQVMKKANASITDPVAGTKQGGK